MGKIQETYQINLCVSISGFRKHGYGINGTAGTEANTAYRKIQNWIGYKQKEVDKPLLSNSQVEPE
jgi:hypothetical protein